MAKVDPFKHRSAKDRGYDASPEVHVFGDGVVCDTDSRGYPTPENRGPEDLVVDASEGFVPLWAPDVTLRWRFQKRSLAVFVDPEGAANEIRKLFGEALIAWGDAAPIKFSQKDDAWDFEIVVKGNDDCSPNGCVLASAFFPDAGRHELQIYPKMFTQARPEQIETMCHEIGHTFGLRHFFANVSESAFPSQIFGKHEAFSIMNYGSKSVLTETDRSDLKTLYQEAWSGRLTHVNGTPIKLVRPFSSLAPVPSGALAFVPQRNG